MASESVRPYSRVVVTVWVTLGPWDEGPGAKTVVTVRVTVLVTSVADIWISTVTSEEERYLPTGVPCLPSKVGVFALKRRPRSPISKDHI